MMHWKLSQYQNKKEHLTKAIKILNKVKPSVKKDVYKRISAELKALIPDKKNEKEADSPSSADQKKKRDEKEIKETIDNLTKKMEEDSVGAYVKLFLYNPGPRAITVTSVKTLYTDSGKTSGKRLSLNIRKGETAYMHQAPLRNSRNLKWNFNFRIEGSLIQYEYPMNR